MDKIEIKGHGRAFYKNAWWNRKETIFRKNAFVAITFSNQIVRKRTLTLEEAFLYAVA